MFDSLPDSIRRRITVTPTCWLWLGAHTSGGYSEVWWEGKVKYVHRIVYELLIGPLPPGLLSDHLCRNRGCVNPSHIEFVTNKENINRGNWKGTGRRRFCSRGHDLDILANITARGRSCRICKNMRAKVGRRR